MEEERDTDGATRIWNYSSNGHIHTTKQLPSKDGGNVHHTDYAYFKHRESLRPGDVFEERQHTVHELYLRARSILGREGCNVAEQDLHSVPPGSVVWRRRGTVRGMPPGEVGCQRESVQCLLLRGGVRLPREGKHEVSVQSGVVYAW